ncbi:unnamed protein product [Schistosoma curassoni]|uniref:Homogentisate 1,2-dioxygenase n=1 Tax=Schistosoma curassoni TaxID=6186 RepID=A0A183KR64_9TREM|nr:unnamed protein product [Schistosoma curassoni]
MSGALTGLVDMESPPRGVEKPSFQTNGAHGLHFSNAHEKFTRVFDQVEFPMDLNELTYTYEAQELQGAAIHMDPRTCIPPAYNPKYKSILEIMFNPWIIKTNFRADLPKNYIWK